MSNNNEDNDDDDDDDENWCVRSNTGRGMAVAVVADIDSVL